MAPPSLSSRRRLLRCVSDPGPHTPARGPAFLQGSPLGFFSSARGREMARDAARRRARAWSIEDPRRPRSAARECIKCERTAASVRTRPGSSRLGPRAHAVGLVDAKTTPQNTELTFPPSNLFPPHSRLSSTSRPPTTSSRLSSRTSTSTARRRLTCPVAAPRS